MNNDNDDEIATYTYKPRYHHERLKPLVTAPSDLDAPIDELKLDPVYQPGIHLRSTETDASELEDSAITVASNIMRDHASSDPKLALDAAKATMAWLGKGAKARTTIFANNAQVNQLPDSANSKHILDSLRDSIGLITAGTKIEEQK